MIPAAEMAQIENTSFSRRVSRVFGLDLHSWEQLMLFSLGIAALAAVAVVVTTVAVVIGQRDENAQTKNEFEAYKIEAGKRSDQLKKETATANAEAAKANLELEKLKIPR